MDPPLVNESSFSSANPSAYCLSEIWLFTGEPDGGGSGLRMRKLSALGESSANRNGSAEESTPTQHSGAGGGRKRRGVSSENESSKMVSISCGTDMNNSNTKRMKVSISNNESGNSKAEIEAVTSADNKEAEESTKPSEPPKQDYIHVRARRGEATDSHSLAERARREKISGRMKILQDLVPGCNKVIGKALILDEIINYIQSLQRQVDLLSMKLEALNSRMNMIATIEGFPSKDLGARSFDASGMIFGPQAMREYAQGSHSEWLHMQVGGSFERAS